jgi:hypothetical protein
MAKPQTRRHCITSKVQSEFGTMYTHIDVGDDGRIIAIRFSAPGKFSDTAIDELLIMLAEAATLDIQAAGGFDE